MTLRTRPIKEQIWISMLEIFLLQFLYKIYRLVIRLDGILQLFDFFEVDEEVVHVGIA